MHDIVIQPLLAGLSTGLFCCTTCLPFVMPYLVAERRGLKRTGLVLLQFVTGRLFGYVLFGAVFGYLGERLDTGLVNVLSSTALVLLSGLLVLYALGLLRPRWSLCERFSARARTPILMGLLMGVNICPPFLLSLAYVFLLHSALKGVVYFLVFFAATTLYFVPLVFLGLLSRMEEFRVVARIAALIVGVLFAAYGIFAITRGAWVVHVP